MAANIAKLEIAAAILMLLFFVCGFGVVIAFTLCTFSDCMLCCGFNSDSDSDWNVGVGVGVGFGFGVGFGVGGVESSLDMLESVCVVLEYSDSDLGLQNDGVLYRCSDA